MRKWSAAYYWRAIDTTALCASSECKETPFIFCQGAQCCSYCAVCCEQESRNDEMFQRAIVCFSTTSPYVAARRPPFTARHQSPGAACHFSISIFEERTPSQERMIMLSPRGKALRSVSARILYCSAAPTGETKRPQPKEGPSSCLSSPLPANDSGDLANGNCHKDGERGEDAPHSTHTHRRFAYTYKMYFTALTHDYAYKLKMHTATYHNWKFTSVNQHMNVLQNV